MSGLKMRANMHFPSILQAVRIYTMAREKTQVDMNPMRHSTFGLISK
jgi:hypothetical protein